jgi:phosphate:Na+ symporter
VIATILGGVGLFLLGMVLMTDGLKAVAGDALRRVLSRFVSGPLSALFSGITVTALLQSSSATTLTTIGFVSAGLLTFPQAVGVIFGANIGTTSTGWLVSLLGLKVNVSAVALPLVGVGALLRLLGRGRLTAVGVALAGFGLIFVGIDTLQAGMRDFATRFDLAAFPADTLGGRLLLVGVGAAMTVVMQSSSAAVATTLAALHGGAIGLEQAAALVIGQNIGTTVTAAIASVGASVPARRTAWAHILFNVITGLLAIAILPLFLRLVTSVAEEAHGDGATAIAGFHTAFNLLGVLLFLPLVGPFSRLIMRLIPEKGPTLTRHLDRTVADVPGVAVEAAWRTARDIGKVLVGVARAQLAPDMSRERTEQELEAAEKALEETQRFLETVGASQEFASVHTRHIQVLHALEHLGLLMRECREGVQVEPAIRSEHLAPIVERVRQHLAAAAGWLAEEREGTSVPGEPQALEGIRRSERVRLLSLTAQGQISTVETSRLLEGLRWLDRMVHHTFRVLEHLHGTAAQPGASAEAPPASSSVASA